MDWRRHVGCVRRQQLNHVNKDATGISRGSGGKCCIPFRVTGHSRSRASKRVVTKLERGNENKSELGNENIRGFPTSGWGRDRTADTRIFSPVLYQLSYPAAEIFCLKDFGGIRIIPARHYFATVRTPMFVITDPCQSKQTA